MSPHDAHPQLVEARLEKLHPTRITVGKRWRTLGKKARGAALASHWFPATVCSMHATGPAIMDL